MKKYKFLIIFVLINVLFLIILILFNKNTVLNNTDLTLLLNGNDVYIIKKNKIEKNPQFEINKNDIYKTYENGIYKGEYKIVKGTVLNLFDSNDNYVKYDGYMFAYKGNEEINVLTPNKRSLNDTEKKYLKNKYKLNISKSNISGNTYEVDLNSDGKLDKIIISTYNDFEKNMSDFYNIILIYMDNKYYELIHIKGIDSINIYTIGAVFNLKNEKYSNILIETQKNYNGDLESSIIEESIYQYKQKKYQKI